MSFKTKALNKEEESFRVEDTVLLPAQKKITVPHFCWLLLLSLTHFC